MIIFLICEIVIAAILIIYIAIGEIMYDRTKYNIPFVDLDAHQQRDHFDWQDIKRHNIDKERDIEVSQNER